MNPPFSRLALAFLLGLPLSVTASTSENAALAAGTPVFDTSKYSCFQLGAGTMADFSEVPVKGQAFDWAIRVKVFKRTPNPWDVQIGSPKTLVAAKKGDWLILSLTARCIDSAIGVAGFDPHVQGDGPFYPEIGAPSTHSEPTAGKEWKRISICRKADQDYAAGKYSFSLHLGTQAQTIEIGNISMVDLGPNVDEAKLPHTAISYPGEEPDAPWRAEAAARIEKYRKGDLTVRVVDGNGNAIPGARVHIQMVRHAYGFGTFLESVPMTDPGPTGQTLRAWTLKLFNRCTTPIYWADWGWADPQGRQRDMECAKWAADNHLDIRGHPIIYPNWSNMPKAVRSLEHDPAALQKRLLQQVAEVTEATKPFNFKEYDVTNELRDCQEIYQIVGKAAVAEWFKVAREHAPAGSRMAINENTILTSGGVTEGPQEIYAGWIQYLMDRGVGPDVIGMQSHFNEDSLTNPETVVKILDRFAKFGKPIQATEFDLPTPDEEGQARFTRDFLTVFFSHPATEAFTMWGFWDGQMWQPSAGLLDKDWKLKPNGKVWMDLVYKQWWTDVQGTSGMDGSCRTRGFLGDYKITVTARGKEKEVPVKLNRDGAGTVVVME